MAAGFWVAAGIVGQGIFEGAGIGGWAEAETEPRGGRQAVDMSRLMLRDKASCAANKVRLRSTPIADDVDPQG